MGTYPVVTIHGCDTRNIAAGYGLDPSTPPRVTAMPTINSVSVPNRNGSYWTQQGRYESQLFTVTLLVVPPGASIDDKYAAVENVIDYWAAICRVPVIPIIYQTSATVTRTTNTRISAFKVDRSALDWCRITMVFEMVDPFWRGTALIVNAPFNFTTNVNNKVLDSSYKGTAPIPDAEFIVTGPFNSGLIVRSAVSESNFHYVKYMGPALTSSQMWWFNAGIQESRIGSGSFTAGGWAISATAHSLPLGKMEIWPTPVIGGTPPYDLKYDIAGVSGASSNTSIQWRARTAWL